ncbi:MAG TPA: formylglycine-generating enzyme family protein [Candidatus Limnocylindrales bacterium]|jgi:formylglycine-generating enzyme required for sulfatase activity|nr:formylglycine-generating enzyme family protein [Candidatus Limnocylindrales bacterium]
MKSDLPSGFILLGLLLAGCERQSPEQAATPSKTPDAKAVAPAGGPAEKGDLVEIKGGRFLMGDKEQVDAPSHEVVVSSFYIDKYPVTQEQYQQVMGDNPSRWKGNKNPVEQVRWSDAVKFCNQRSQLEKRQPCYDLKTWKCNFEADGYRLPTEAEWEYACRAGTTTAFFFGDNPAKLSEYAWFEKNSGGRPQPVGQKQPNAWGLYDICGNVWEWCNDFYKVDYYKESLQTDPRGPDEGQTKVVRGGAWRFKPENCRSGYRYNENPGYADVCFGYDIYGFRCVRKATSGSVR